MKIFFNYAMCQLSTQLSNNITSFIAALIGGLCTLGGSALTAYLQDKKNKEAEAKKVQRELLLDYYAFLGKYISKISHIIGGNAILLQKYINDMIEDFHNHSFFVYYIYNQWMRDECIEFERKIQTEVDNYHISDCSQGEKKEKLLEIIKDMQSTIMKKLEEQKDDVWETNL